MQDKPTLSLEVISLCPLHPHHTSLPPILTKVTSLSSITREHPSLSLSSFAFYISNPLPLHFGEPSGSSKKNTKERSKSITEIKPNLHSNSIISRRSSSCSRRVPLIPFSWIQRLWRFTDHSGIPLWIFLTSRVIPSIPLWINFYEVLPALWASHNVESSQERRRLWQNLPKILTPTSSYLLRISITRHRKFSLIQEHLDHVPHALNWI
jgi:hypothetical protein